MNPLGTKNIILRWMCWEGNIRQGLEKSVLQIKWTYSRILFFFWEKINKMDKTESYIFIADNAELGNFFKNGKKIKKRN